jgi:hypothetical protein
MLRILDSLPPQWCRRKKIFHKHGNLKNAEPISCKTDFHRKMLREQRKSFFMIRRQLWTYNDYKYLSPNIRALNDIKQMLIFLKEEKNVTTKDFNTWLSAKYVWFRQKIKKETLYLNYMLNWKILHIYKKTPSNSSKRHIPFKKIHMEYSPW